MNHFKYFSTDSYLMLAGLRPLLKTLLSRLPCFVLFSCAVLHSFEAFASSREKGYVYWTWGHSSDLKIGNKDTMTKYETFKAENPDVKAHWLSNMKIAGYVNKSNGNLFGAVFGLGGYNEKANEAESMDVSITKFYVSYLSFLFSNTRGLFVELSSGLVLAGFDSHNNGVYTNSSSKQEYGYGASAALGYEFRLISVLGFNIQGEYNFAHSTSLGKVTWIDYGASLSFMF